MRSLENAMIHAVESQQIIGYKQVTILPTGKVLKLDTGIQGVILSDSGESSTKISKQKPEMLEDDCSIMSINRKFTPVLQDNALVVNCGGRASGKTTVSVIASILETYKPLRRNVLVLRFSKSAVKDSIYSEIVKFIETQDLEEEFSIEQNQIVNNLTGSKILFKGIKSSSLDVKDTLKGITDMSYVLIEESADLNEDLDETLELIRGTMRSKGMFYRMQLVLNPRSKAHNIYKRFFAGLEDPSNYCGEHKGSYLITSSYKDNPFLPSIFIKNTILKTKEVDSDTYDHIYGGKWKDLGQGQIIKKFELGEYQEVSPTIIGIDLGFRDETAGLMVSIDRDNKIAYLKLVLYGTNFTNDDLLAELIPYQGFTMVMDSARPEIIEDFNRKGFRVKGAIKGAGSVLDGITRMTSFKMVIDPANSDRVIEAFQNYSWSKSSVERPDHSYSHVPDAVRYAIMELTTGASGKYAIDFGYGEISTRFNKSYDRYSIHT